MRDKEKRKRSLKELTDKRTPQLSHSSYRYLHLNNRNQMGRLCLVMAIKLSVLYLQWSHKILEKIQYLAFFARQLSFSKFYLSPSLMKLSLETTGRKNVHEFPCTSWINKKFVQLGRLRVVTSWKSVGKCKNEIGISKDKTGYPPKRSSYVLCCPSESEFYL